LGELPTAATAGSGEVAIEQAVDAIKSWVRRLLTTSDTHALHEFYGQRRNEYAAFVAQYFNGSYEDAAAAWWSDRVKRD
jgi:hypothetical protein